MLPMICRRARGSRRRRRRLPTLGAGGGHRQAIHARKAAKTTASAALLPCTYAVCSQQQRSSGPRCLTMLTTSFMLAPAPTSPAASVARQCWGVMQLPGVMEGIAPHAPC